MTIPIGPHSRHKQALCRGFNRPLDSMLLATQHEPPSPASESPLGSGGERNYCLCKLSLRSLQVACD